MDRLSLATKYRDMGLSVVPVSADGTKTPALPSWKEYQERLATDDELRHWFGNGFNYGIGFVCGKVSRGLEVIDFDTEEAYLAWKNIVENESPALLSTLPRVKTPGHHGTPGRHVYVFHGEGEVPGNRKLAKDEAGTVIIETRGEGGFVVAPGSPPECHPEQGTYEWEHPLEDVGV